MKESQNGESLGATRLRTIIGNAANSWREEAAETERDSVQELVDEYQHSLKRELAATEIEMVFQTRSQKIKHHHVILRFSLI